jgi:predicted RNase H-related nuclease YkuK (DUF458 family)
MEYKTLGNKKVVENIGSYIKDKIKNIPYTKIYVGTDSQNKDTITHYVTAIVIHFNGNNGGHVIYAEEKVPIIKDRFTKLWGEVTRSLDVANFLKDDCGIPVQYIDLDLNSNVKWDSNKVLTSAVGLIKSSGFEARFKPNDAYAVRIADVLCK